jgi:glutamate dehydrogenase (NADP+)
MTNIHASCVRFGLEPSGKINYIKGANLGGFVKVAEAMMAQGVV